MTLSLFAIEGLPIIRSGDDLPGAILAAVQQMGEALRDGDILVVCQKIVSKAEGRTVDLRTVVPSPLAKRIAGDSPDKDARFIEVVLRETTRIVRMDNGVLIVETGPGWVCANAGVDRSNSGDPDVVVLLPEDPDRSARVIAEAARARANARVAVLVTDTFGRPWRQGLVDFALGVAGMPALLDLRGTADLDGRELHHTVMAQADAVAAAAGLLMTKGAGVPAVVVRGYAFTSGEGSGTELLRPREADLFR